MKTRCKTGERHEPFAMRTRAERNLSPRNMPSLRHHIRSIFQTVSYMEAPHVSEW